MTQPCPFCDAPAAASVCHDPYGSRYDCPTCGTFFIDSVAEERIAWMQQEFRDTASKKAKGTPPGKLFVLRGPRPDELGGDGHGVARTTMIGEYVPLH